ncbi:MAG TPA: hypothetical protein VFG87_04405 [Amycolatopsis sp.]|jgi:hypothetical protein|nr:hypothetical protein [Amycolatopsis sp.]
MNGRYPAVEGELEDELARELEDEFEDELEDEFEGELEDEFEDEFEATARELEDELEDEFEDFADSEGEFEDLVRELEAEFEGETEGEDEAFANPARRVYPDAELMAELALQAENAETEAEAEAFLGALAPLAIQAAKWAAPKIIKHAPKLIRGAVSLGKRLWRNPATRQAVRQVPKILARTAKDVGHRYAQGQPIDGRYVSRRLVGHALNATGGRAGTRRGAPARARRAAPRARAGAARRRVSRTRRAGAVRGKRARGRARRR